MELFYTQTDDHELLYPFSEHESLARGRTKQSYSALVKKELEDSRKAQANTGFRYWVSRKILNEQDFIPQLEVWQKIQSRFPVKRGQEKPVKRRELRQFSLTLYNSDLLPPQDPIDTTDAEMLETIQMRHDNAASMVGPLIVSHVRCYGAGARTHIGLSISDADLYNEHISIRNMLIPRARIDDSGLPYMSPHVSLGKISIENKSQREAVIDEITTGLSKIALPQYVMLGPIEVHRGFNS